MRLRNEVLSRCKPGRCPSQHVFLDCETWTAGRPQPGEVDIHRFRLACASTFRVEAGRATRHERQRFGDKGSLWAWIDRIAMGRRRIVVWCHNAAYDAAVSGLWERVDRNEIRVNFASLESPPFIVCLSRGETDYLFLDTMNFFPMPLSQLGQSVGLPKLAMPANDASDSEWFQYCERDVLIIERVVETLISWLHTSGFGGPGVTASSTALKVYQSCFLPHDVPLPAGKLALQLEREAYFGGRAEAYYLGVVCPESWETIPTKKSIPFLPSNQLFGPVTEFDVRSLYPAVMSWNQYPAGPLDLIESTDTMLLRKELDRSLCIARVKVRSRSTYPVRHHKLGTVYASGSFWTTLSTPELMRAVRRRELLAVSAIETHRPSDLFSVFINRLWKYRRDAEEVGSEAFSLFAKYLMNGLYGSFGRHAHTYERKPELDNSLRWGHSLYRDIDLDTDLSVCFVGGVAHAKQTAVPDELGHVLIPEHHSSYPAIAAHVTAYAREHMRVLIEIAGKTNVIYSDTDSIWCLPEGTKRIEASEWLDKDKLGFLAHKRTGNNVQIRGVKDYIWDGTESIAGLKRGSILQADGTYAADHWAGLHEIIDSDNKGVVTVSGVRHRLTRNYRKGKVGSDGWVTPWEFPIPGEQSVRLEQP